MNNKLSLKGGIFKSAIILTIAGVLSKLLGFYFRILLTNYTGATENPLQHTANASAIRGMHI